MKLLLTFQHSSLACVSFLEIHTELWGRHLIGTPLRLGFMSPLQPTHHFVSLLHGQPTVRKMTVAHSHHHVMFCFSEQPLLGYNLVSGLNVRCMPDDPAKTQHQPIRCRRRLLWVVWQTSAFPKNWPLNFTEHSKLAIVFVFFLPSCVLWWRPVRACVWEKVICECELIKFHFCCLSDVVFSWLLKWNNVVS